MLWSILLCVQVLGLGITWLTRVTSGCEMQCFCQKLFLVCFGLVSVATMVGMMLGTVYCLMSGVSLSVMALGAVSDLRPNSKVPTF